MIKRQVLPAALHMFLRQHKEKTPRHYEDPDPVDHQENPVVPGVALQVHGDLEKQSRELLML
jgi:hypothetical protein